MAARRELPPDTARCVIVGGGVGGTSIAYHLAGLGWELYCPSEYGLTLWRTLCEAGRPHGIVAGGYRAIDSMRLEKGYRV